MGTYNTTGVLDVRTAKKCGKRYFDGVIMEDRTYPDNIVSIEKDDFADEKGNPKKYMLICRSIYDYRIYRIYGKTDRPEALRKWIDRLFDEKKFRIKSALN